jgi:hypothetical protein
MWGGNEKVDSRVALKVAAGRRQVTRTRRKRRKWYVVPLSAKTMESWVIERIVLNAA